jgi:uroporphyrinogen decarboxylase
VRILCAGLGRKEEEMQTQKQALLAAYRHEQPDFVPCANLTAVFRCPTDRYYGPDSAGPDLFGVLWQKSDLNNPLAGMTPVPGNCVLDDITRWKELKFPDLDSIDWKQHAGAALRGVDREQTAVTGLIGSGLFERLNQLMGMENALCAFYEEPEATKEFFAALTGFKLRCIDKLVEYGDPDIIHMHDDWGMATNTFFSADIWREFFKPFESRFADYIHQKGKLYEHHSCGYITPLVGDLVEIGVDALNPLNVCNDIAGIKRDYGAKITLVGGADNQKATAPNATDGDLRREIRRSIDLYAPGGSFASYFIATTQEEERIAIEEAVGYGADFYKRTSDGQTGAQQP